MPSFLVFREKSTLRMTFSISLLSHGGMSEPERSLTWLSESSVAPSSNPSTHPLAHPCYRCSHCARRDVRGRKKLDSSTKRRLLHHQILPHPEPLLAPSSASCTPPHPLAHLAILARTAPGGMCDIVNSFTLVPGAVGVVTSLTTSMHVAGTFVSSMTPSTHVTGTSFDNAILVPSSTPSMLVTGTFSSSIIDSFLARRHCVAPAIINTFHACHRNL
ncbi:uncharacterized protein G2W53_041825 [Senna tora]|uniref:Uncharacterized protein n=1 Tax=Senna tora TaxID=362788 RepID=A0A834W386_9FABA|nr:uncharacterized protein G2W53_041825 [Senna tora]